MMVIHKSLLLLATGALLLGCSGDDEVLRARVAAARNNKLELYSHLQKHCPEWRESGECVTRLSTLSVLPHRMEDRALAKVDQGKLESELRAARANAQPLATFLFSTATPEPMRLRGLARIAAIPPECTATNCVIVLLARPSDLPSPGTVGLMKFTFGSPDLNDIDAYIVKTHGTAYASYLGASYGVYGVLVRQQSGHSTLFCAVSAPLRPEDATSTQLDLCRLNLTEVRCDESCMDPAIDKLVLSSILGREE
ncbi:MAG TPA: hypothetical protein VG900_09535 [Hyphomicrobiaceae bacterium]|nr:hypothetical protein [Hyphomicrobiaceae bacterium]